jgi:hypothetical protein
MPCTDRHARTRRLVAVGCRAPPGLRCGSVRRSTGATCVQPRKSRADEPSSGANLGASCVWSNATRRWTRRLFNQTVLTAKRSASKVVLVAALPVYRATNGCLARRQLPGWRNASSGQRDAAGGGTVTLPARTRSTRSEQNIHDRGCLHAYRLGPELQNRIG